MLSSTMRPMAMARPARLIKLMVQLKVAITDIVIITLRGMEMAMMRVGRRVLAMPRRAVGDLEQEEEDGEDGDAEALGALADYAGEFLLELGAVVLQEFQADVGGSARAATSARTASVTAMVLASGRRRMERGYGGAGVGAGDGVGFGGVNGDFRDLGEEDGGGLAAGRGAAGGGCAAVGDGDAGDGVQVGVAVIGAEGEDLPSRWRVPALRSMALPATALMTLWMLRL